MLASTSASSGRMLLHPVCKGLLITAQPSSSCNRSCADTWHAIANLERQCRRKQLCTCRFGVKGDDGLLGRAVAHACLQRPHLGWCDVYKMPTHDLFKI